MENTVQESVSYEKTVSQHYAEVRKLKAELKEQRAMLKDAYENDKEYHEAQEAIKEKQRRRAELKKILNDQPAIAALKAKIKDLSTELKDGQLALFDYLGAYVKHSGMTTIELEGETKKIVTQYKLFNG